MADTDYVLGTHDDEIERLELQHRVWRERVLDCWRRAGIKPGNTVMDVGCGPGFAALDLAGIVGPAGIVKALERSKRFLSHLDASAKQQGIANIEPVMIDFNRAALPKFGADAAWCRWVLCFLPRPEMLIEQMAAAVRPGGTVVFHEYLNYGTWELAPHQPEFSLFVQAVMASWRNDRGDPNVGLRLPSMLHDAGFEIIYESTIIDVLRPMDFAWQWPEAFLTTNSSRLIELGELSAEDAQAAISAFEAVKRSPAGRMITPVVLEIIARRS